MALNYVTLILDLYDGQGNMVISGTAALVPSAQLTDTTDNQVITQAPVPGVFHSSGFPNVKLLATDNGALAPAGWGWTVSYSGVPGSPAGFSFFLPFTGGATQYLSSLTPVSSVVTMAAYMPLPSGTPISGQAPIATGAGEASAWGNVAANPMTTSGDTVYGGTSGAITRLAGDTSNTRKFLRGQSSGGVAQPPAWDTIAAGDVPTLNQNTSGTAAGLSATLAIGSGGTGQTTQQAAIDALAGAVTSAQYLRGTGTHVQMSAIQAADLPTLDLIPAPGAAVSLNSKKITNLANGTVSTDAAAFGQLPALTAADTSAVVAGTSTAPTVRTNTIDVIAAQHPAAADWSNNSHKITSLLNGSGAQDAAAFGQIPLADSTATNIQPPGTQSAGSSGKWPNSDHVHPRDSPQAADQNLLAWAYDPIVATNSSVPASGVVQLMRVILRTTQTVTNVLVHVAVLGTGFTASQNFAGLYTSSGTLLSATADQAAAWGSTGLKTMALTSTQTNLAAGTYYVALVQNGSANLALARTGGLASESALINAGLTATTARFATGPTVTSLGAITMSSNTLATVGFWAALS
jgi:hypothetical protein